jgi:hypothetical protein
MFLITSAAYITGELATEFGKIPPAFLPLQNKRLFKHQIKIAGNSKDVVLSLPKGYIISEIDYEILTRKGVIIVYVPTELSLGQSIVYVLNYIAKYYEPLKILHGDTLFTELPKDHDIYSISKPSDNYSWANSIDNQDYVYSGFFSFTSQSLLLRSLTESNYDFINAITLYKSLLNVKEVILEEWFDFGHANTYYRSKVNMTTQRKFNNLEIDGFSVKKYSRDKNKMMAESNWFVNLPIPMKKYLPNLWDSWVTDNEGFYEIDYLYLSTLADLYAFGNNPYFIWESILSACNVFLLNCLKYKAPNEFIINKDFKKLYGKKTITRLLEFASKTNINLEHKWILNGVEVPSLIEIANEMDEFISDPKTENLTIIHGDFCFSNIFYNFRTQSIKVIDPRGIDAEGNQTIYGDIRYDIAKLGHSVIGLYDFIMAGRYTLFEEDNYNIHFTIPIDDTTLHVQKLFRQNHFANMKIEDSCTYPILVHLFLSMLPLHSDAPDKQKAMLANALRLYLEFIEIKKQ